MKVIHFFLILFLGIFAGAFIQAEEADEIAAQVGDEQITMAELGERTQADMQQINIQIYNIRKTALRNMIDERLLNQEASTREISKEDLLEEINKSASPVIEDDIKKYYEAKKARMKGDFEEVRSRIESHLKSKAFRNARTTALKELKKKYTVKMNLVAPRFEIPILEDAITKGPEDAPIQLVVFTDFECPFCKRGADTVNEVFQAYPGKIQIIFRDFPLNFHKNAKPAANAARCANDQGEFWNYYALLFKNQGKLDGESLIKYAAGLGLDMKAFEGCVDSNKYGTVIESELAAGRALGVSGTPAHFVNGLPLSGAVPLESFKEMIDEELEKL